MAVAMRAPPPPLALGHCSGPVVDSADRFYKFGTPSPPSVPEYSPPSCYSELEESGFHSDEEIQKVRETVRCGMLCLPASIAVFMACGALRKLSQSGRRALF